MGDRAAAAIPQFRERRAVSHRMVFYVVGAQSERAGALDQAERWLVVWEKFRPEGGNRGTPFE